MECFRGLFGYWKPDGNCHQQDPPVFYVHFDPDPGVTDHYLYGTCILAEYPEIYLGCEEKSLVLSLKNRNAKAKKIENRNAKRESLEKLKKGNRLSMNGIYFLFSIFKYFRFSIFDFRVSKSLLSDPAH